MRRWTEGVIRHRLLVVVLTTVVTVGLALPIQRLRVQIDPSAMLPRMHPYVAATDRVDALFGGKYVVVIGVTPRTGDAFDPRVLAAVARMTAALGRVPGVVPGGVLSLASPRARGIAGVGGALEVRPLMERVPQSREQLAALRQVVRANPVYVDAIVSRDERTALVLAEFRDPAGGFRAIMDPVEAIVRAARDPELDIVIGGHPRYLAEMERFSHRMAFLFPLAVVLIGLIHFEAFRTVQGLVLPLVTALLAVVWGLGIMATAGVTLDVFNATTPILILAVAAGHAVQILERYYEEFQRLRGDARSSPAQASTAAIVEALARVGPAMLTAGAVAALSFLSLLVFDIATIRTFGVFTALGIVSALVLELTFIPALRSWLPPPGPAEARRGGARSVWDRLAAALAAGITGPWRRWIDAAIVLVVAASLAGAHAVVIDNSMKGYFSPSVALRRDDAALDARSGGTNRLNLLFDGGRDDAVKEPRLLRAIEATERFLEVEPDVGKTLSLVDFLRRMNRALHDEDPAFDRLPDEPAQVAQLLFLHSLGGAPGDLDAYVDYPYRTSNVWVFLRTDASARVEALVARLRAFLAARFGDEVTVSIGGSVPMAVALTDVMVRGKLLNIAQIAAVIFVLSAAVFRSWAAGALVLVPLALAVAATFGLMGLVGIPLNVPTSVVTAMAVGIGADYAIYLIARLREERARGADEVAAIRTALTTAGKAILYVATAVAGGYGVLMFSWDFRLHTWLAVLIAVAMLVSSLGALVVLPRIIALTRPRFIVARAPARAASTVAGVALVGAWLAMTPAAGAAPPADEIMARSFAASRVPDSKAEGTVTLINRAGQERVRRTFGVTKLRPNGVDTMRMLRFLTPSDVRGTATLLIERSDGDDDIWVYLPALRKVRRLVAANKKDAFVGTDFSYGDILGHKVGDWEHRLLREDTLDGQPCYVIESVPRSEAVRAASGYSRRVEWVRTDNAVTLRAEMWDLAGEPLKVFVASDVRQVDAVRGKWQAMRLEMTTIQTGHRTLIRYERFQTNQGIADDFFTPRYLDREP